MLPLIQFFFEICMLRKAPQDLSASPALLGVTLLADLLVGMMLAAAVGLSPGLGLAQGMVDIAFTLALLYGALYVRNHLPRFQQSATALLGTSALLGFIAAMPLSMLPRAEGAPVPGGATLLFMVLVVWSILITGHILRHTFDLRLTPGVGIAIVYNFLAYTLVSGLFSGA